jgi:hypothetical protein
MAAGSPSSSASTILSTASMLTVSCHMRRSFVGLADQISPKLMSRSFQIHTSAMAAVTSTAGWRLAPGPSSALLTRTGPSGQLPAAEIDDDGAGRVRHGHSAVTLAATAARAELALGTLIRPRQPAQQHAGERLKTWADLRHLLRTYGPNKITRQNRSTAGAVRSAGGDRQRAGQPAVSRARTSATASTPACQLGEQGTSVNDRAPPST